MTRNISDLWHPMIINVGDGHTSPMSFTTRFPPSCSTNMEARSLIMRVPFGLSPDRHRYHHPHPHTLTRPSTMLLSRPPARPASDATLPAHQSIHVTSPEYHFLPWRATYYATSPQHSSSRTRCKGTLFSPVHPQKWQAILFHVSSQSGPISSELSMFHNFSWKTSNLSLSTVYDPSWFPKCVAEGLAFT